MFERLLGAWEALDPRPFVTALALVLLVTTVPVAASDGEAPQVPCSDDTEPNAGCPDLTVDPAKMAEIRYQTLQFSEDSCSVVEGHTEPGIRDLLRFTFTTPNVGDGDLIIGDPDDHPEWFDLHTCHGHSHFVEYADYRLWTLDGYAEWKTYRMENPEATDEEAFEENPELEDEFVAGNKMGFCVIDIQVYLPVESFGPRYTSCASDQGIQVGWADEYHWSLDGQWIDITDVAPGSYMLEAEVNDDRLYVETDYTNNDAAIPVVVPP